jgi:SAM-dependent methyltransferase
MMSSAMKAIRSSRVISTGERMLLEQVLRVGDVRIIEGLSMFKANSAASIRDQAALTLQAANQVFPLMVELRSRTGGKVAAPVPVEDFAKSSSKGAAAELAELYNRHGSDKASPHSYHLLYGSILAEPDSITALLEIGLGTNNVDVPSHMGKNGKPGASLRAFRDFLPKAQIYGADVDRRILFSEERIKTFYVDQTDPRSFGAVGEAVGDDLDLIIDDGLHAPHANLATLSFALDRLKPGGWFVVEDIPQWALPVWQVVPALLPESYDCAIVAFKDAYTFVVRAGRFTG